MSIIFLLFNNKRMNINEFNITFLILIIIYICYEFIYDGTENYESSIDGKCYKVRRGDSELQQKVDNLAIINLKLNTIVKSLDQSEYSHLENVIRLIKNWNKGVSIKEIGLMEDDAAYVIDKHKMAFCLRTSPKGGDLESLNLLTYVAIHELSHVMSIETDHGEEFKNNFKFLLNYAKTVEYINPLTLQKEYIYVSINPQENKKDSNFCGVEISNGSIK